MMARSEATSGMLLVIVVRGMLLSLRSSSHLTSPSPTFTTLTLSKCGKRRHISSAFIRLELKCWFLCGVESLSVFAPCSINTLHISVYPLKAACQSGVRPSVVTSLVSYFGMLASSCDERSGARSKERTEATSRSR